VDACKSDAEEERVVVVVADVKPYSGHMRADGRWLVPMNYSYNVPKEEKVDVYVIGLHDAIIMYEGGKKTSPGVGEPMCRERMMRGWRACMDRQRGHRKLNMRIS